MRSTELYKTLVDHVGCGVVVVDQDLRVELWNEWMVEVSGITQERACDARLESLLPGLLDSHVGRAIRSALTAGRSRFLSCTFHERPLLQTEDAPPHSLMIHAIDDSPPRAMIVAHDASCAVVYAEHLAAVRAQNAAQARALRKEKDRFDRFAQFDQLTGLANRHTVRHYLADALQENIDTGRVGAVVMLDIDRFGDVNSSAGPNVANEVLRGVARRLTDSVRPADTVARMGGDKFVVVLSYVGSAAHAETTGRRLLKVFDAPFVVDDREIFLSASIGITVFPNVVSGDEETGAAHDRALPARRRCVHEPRGGSLGDGAADRLLTNVETAVGRAKKEGGGGLQIYRGAMDEEVARRLALSTALRYACENGEFELVYQPQVACPDHTIVGVEALLRWSHPDWGVVSPLQFVPVLEETGMIMEVGEWVLLEACRQGQLWRENGHPAFRMSVNVSARQFQGDVLCKTVARVLENTGFPAGDLELEVTESMLMNDVDSSIRMLSALKRLGVRVAIDDFGTGYSSLAYLRRFPVDTLKIDRDFTRNIATDRDDLAICKTIITLGHVLELGVLAEGVEDADQLACLQDSGCHLFQGFYFGRPMAPPELDSWLRARTEPVVPDRLIARILADPSAVDTPARTRDDGGVTPPYPADEECLRPSDTVTDGGLSAVGAVAVSANVPNSETPPEYL